MMGVLPRGGEGGEETGEPLMGHCSGSCFMCLPGLICDAPLGYRLLVFGNSSI